MTKAELVDYVAAAVQLRKSHHAVLAGRVECVIAPYGTVGGSAAQQLGWPR
jgi:hypothetical protein